MITEVLEAKHSRVTRGVEALGPEVEIPIQALMELENEKGREADCEREREIIRKIATKQGRLKLLGGGKTGSAPIKSTPTPISSTAIMGVQRNQTAGNDEAVIVEGLDISEEVLAWRSIPEQKMRNSQMTESEGGLSQGTDLYCFDYLSVDARNGERCTKRVCGLKHEYPAECDLARVRRFWVAGLGRNVAPNREIRVPLISLNINFSRLSEIRKEDGSPVLNEAAISKFGKVISVRHGRGHS